MIKEILNNSRYFYWLVAVYFLGLLCVGYIAEYFFNIQPCSLCYFQRYVMMALVVLSMGVVISGYDGRVFLFILCLCAFSGFVLSAFHIGVEQKWWAMPQSCVGKVELVSKDPKEMLASLQAQMKNQKMTRCDQVNWRLFGFPASWWTCLAFLFSITLMVWRQWFVRNR